MTAAPCRRSPGRFRSRRVALALTGALVGCGLVAPAGDEVRTDLWTGLDCRSIAVPPGPEDVAIDHEAGVAYVASTDRWAARADTALGRRLGHLSRLDLRAERPEAVDVTPPELRTPSFRPQGIGLLDEDGAKRLFVVNRRPVFQPEAGMWDGCRLDNAIEVLAVEADGPNHLETITGAALIRPNDVAPVSADGFYVTNDHGTTSCAAQNLRDLFGLNEGHLVAYDGARWRVAADGLPFANGVAFDAARNLVHVSASQAGAVHAFTHAAGDASPLRPARPPLRLAAAPDNLTLRPDGTLLVAAHPDRVAFLLYARRWIGAERAPSSVIEVEAPASPSPRARQIFRDDGGRLPAASVAATWHWPERGVVRLLLGTVFADRVLLCDRPAKEKAAPESGAASEGSGRQKRRPG